MRSREPRWSARICCARSRTGCPGTETTISYGSTEMGIATTLGDHDLFRKSGSIGRPNPGFDAAIIDGELCLSGETVMSGYFDLPDETAAVLENGWYNRATWPRWTTRAISRITGRRREIIRSGGETIAPSEVEAALEGFPGVREVGVVGLPDATWGEIVCAVLVLEPGASAPSVESIRAHVGHASGQLQTPACGGLRRRLAPHGGNRTDSARPTARLVARRARQELTGRPRRPTAHDTPHDTACRARGQGRVGARYGRASRPRAIVRRAAPSCMPRSMDSSRVAVASCEEMTVRGARQSGWDAGSGSTGSTSNQAPPSVPDSRATRRASWSMRPPRPTLTRSAPGLSASNSFVLSGFVSSVNAAARMRTSVSANTRRMSRTAHDAVRRRAGSPSRGVCARTSHGARAQLPADTGGCRSPPPP